jgi:hypothetical protein
MNLQRLIITASFTVLAISCVNNKEQENDTTKEVKPPIDCYSIFQELYNELLSFKSQDDFLLYGFGQGGNYYEWLKAVEEVNDEDCKSLIKEHGFVFSELKALGLEYVNTAGRENDYTQFLNSQFRPKEITSEPEKELDVSNELIGKWKLYNSYAPDESIEMHIVFLDGFYFEYFPHNESKKKLSKDGNKYSIVGDKNGEYYVLGSNGKLEMYDSEGNLDEVGWSAKSL